MYVGRRYTVNATYRLKSRFDCVSCGYEADMIVSGVGTGVGRSPYMLDDEGAARRAHSEAESNAHANAHAIVSSGLALCPKCLKRDPETERKFKHKTITYIIVAFVICAGVGSLLFVQMRDWFAPALISVTIVVLASFVIWSMQSKALRSAVQQVHYLPKEKSVRESKKKKKKKKSPVSTA